jgi:hypothetical protein
MVRQNVVGEYVTHREAIVIAVTSPDRGISWQPREAGGDECAKRGSRARGVKGARGLL